MGWSVSLGASNLTRAVIEEIHNGSVKCLAARSSSSMFPNFSRRQKRTYIAHHHSPEIRRNETKIVNCRIDDTIERTWGKK